MIKTNFYNFCFPGLFMIKTPLFKPITKKPEDFESDIFIAAKKENFQVFNT